MRDEALGKFLDRLASADPTPGGGSASALAGAMAAGLLAMVSRLSMGKGEREAGFEQTLSAMESARAGLIDLAVRDAEAFDAVIRAMRLPKAMEEEKRRRQGAVQEALRTAAEVPLEVARHALAVLEAAPALARAGNPNAISDVGVGALLAHAAVHGSLLNVRINLKSIKDEAYRAAAAEAARDLETRSDGLRDAALGVVRDRLPCMAERADRLALTGMRLFGYHGVLPEERARGQEFVVDVELEGDLRPAGRTDDLRRAIDYRKAYEVVKGVVEGEPRQLIEALAEEIARRLLALDRVTAVTVRVRKPGVKLGGPLAHAGVEIRRARR